LAFFRLGESDKKVSDLLLETLHKLLKSFRQDYIEDNGFNKWPDAVRESLNDCMRRKAKSDYITLNYAGWKTHYVYKGNLFFPTVFFVARVGPVLNDDFSICYELETAFSNDETLWNETVNDTMPCYTKKKTSNARDITALLLEMMASSGSKRISADLELSIEKILLKLN